MLDESSGHDLEYINIFHAVYSIKLITNGATSVKVVYEGFCIV